MTCELRVYRAQYPYKSLVSTYTSRMFTGIIEGVGEVISIHPDRMQIEDSGAWPSDPWTIGESISVNGCCLTLVSYEQGLTFDLSRETWERTSFSHLQKGARVNLERAMRVDGRFGGHIVQGHVDSVGTLVSATRVGLGWDMTFEVTTGKYLIDKGSITIDGVSLTVVEPMDTSFRIAVIPHTHQSTFLGSVPIGGKVNIEYDVIAKYVEKLLSPQARSL